jgi:hypothetical protein
MKDGTIVFGIGILFVAVYVGGYMISNVIEPRALFCGTGFAVAGVRMMLKSKKV